MNEPGPTREPTAAATPPVTEPGRFERPDWLGCAAASLVMFGVYVSTLAPNLTLGNSGILTTGALYAGVPSNPGHPVWVLYSWLFAHLLPFANVAWRVALGSAVASAAACGLVALMTARGSPGVFAGTVLLTRLSPRNQAWLRTACGGLAGLGFGLSRPVWSQAVIVETWALTHLLTALTLALLLRWALAPAQRRFLVAAVFVFGLLLTSAQHLIVLAPAIAGCVLLREPKLGRDFAWTFLPLVALAMLPSGFPVYAYATDEFNRPLLVTFLLPLAAAFGVLVRSGSFGVHWRICLAVAVLLLAGLSFSLYPALASLSNPPVNWGYPRRAEGFWHIFMRGQYERVMPVKSLPLFLGQVWMLLLGTAAKLGWQYVVFAPLPLLFLPRLTHGGRLWLGALLLVWLCAGPLLLTQINPPVAGGVTDLLMLHFVPALLPVACLAGWGLLLFAARLLRPKSPGAAAAG